MRKFFVLIAVAIVCFAFISCGENNAKTDNDLTDEDIIAVDNIPLEDVDYVTDEDTVLVTYKGMAMKGPFYAGGNVTVFACDENGIQTGEAYTSHIENSTGNFTLDAEVNGTVIVKAEGVYFNEIYNESSTGTVRIEAVFNATGSGIQNAFLNPISHIISYCKLKGIQSGDTDGVAEIACATLLFDELGLPKPDPFTVETLRDIQYPYPIAFSCGISQAAKLIAQGDKSKFDTELQRILDQAKIELATGSLSEGTKIIFRNGFATLDAEVCRSNLQTYLDIETEGIIIPPLGEALDTDGDGIPDSIDPDIDEDGIVNELDCIVGKTDFVNLAVMNMGYFCAQKNSLLWECKDIYHNDILTQSDVESWTHDFDKIVSGNSHICGLKNSKIWCWHDGVINTMTQTQDSEWKNIFAGKNRLCGISKIDNFLYCWENNFSAGSIKINEENWTFISLGNEKVWGIKTDGSLWNWNYNDITATQVGTDQWKLFSNDSLYAIKIDGTLWSFVDESLPLEISSDINWKMIAGTCAIKTDDSTWCWDENTTLPAQKIDFGWSCGEWQNIFHNRNISFPETDLYCGIKSDNSIWCWKDNVLTHFE